ncbi:MAG: N-acetylmuramoyl-L-alanine amidase [Ectothiorhodospiraceae bacterium]|nr:N-acetylmuramoyl-L-alanine amidase [Ectothiorhodospiraceae bacterium]
MRVASHRLVDHEFRALEHFGGVIEPRFVVVHYTAGGSLDGSFAALDRVGLSAHVLLDRDGTVVQLVEFNRRAFHAGQSRWKGFTGLNHHSIGIEVCNYGWLLRRGDGRFQRPGETPVFEPEQVVVASHRNGWPRDVGWEIYPPKQLAALRELCAALLDAYPSIGEIVGHDDIAPERKQDPGPAMPMASLQHLTERGGAGDAGRTYEVIARNGLRLRAGPGTEHAVVAVMRAGQRVTVTDDQGVWYPVDLEGDGAIDGFAHGDFLRAV